MNTDEIVRSIDDEISRLQRARSLLAGTTGIRRAGRPAKSAATKATSFVPAEFTAQPAKRRTMSAAGRARVAAAQKKRWAALKAGATAAVTPKAKPGPKPKSKKTGGRTASQPAATIELQS